MTGSKFIALTAALVAVMGAYGTSLTAARAAEEAPQSETAGQEAAPPNVGGEAEAKQPPRTPIRFTTVDYQDAGGGPGKLKLAGTAAPGTTLYLFLDDQPYVKLVADGEGNWGVESELELDDQRHTLRAEQYDKDTNMLAGRAMVSIARSKPDSAP